MAAMALKLSPELSLLSRYNLAVAQDLTLGSDRPASRRAALAPPSAPSATTGSAC